MLIILNKLTLERELQNFKTNNVFGQKNKTQQQQIKIQHKNPCLESNPGPLAPQSDALSLELRDN